MKTRITLFFGLVSLILVGAIFTSAQQPGDGHPPPPFFGGRMAQDLGLTDDQKAKIKDIVTAERTITDPLMKQLGDLRQQLDAATANGQFDEAIVTALAAQQAKLMASLTVEHERTKANIYNTVLTSDQKTKLQQLHANHENHPRPVFDGAPPPPAPSQN